jgi:hypothetical protein
MKNTLLLLSVFALSMAGCKKADLAGNNPTGEGLVQFTLLTPSSGTTLQMNSATPNQAINFTWNPSKPGLTTAPTYKVVAVLKTAADFETPMLEFPSNNSGQATSLTLTYQQLDAALQTKGVAAGATTELKWSVKATNADVTVLAISSFNITVTRFQNGASPFKLLGPVPTTAAMEINPTSTTDNITFNWTKSVPGTGSPAVSYRILFSNNGSFTTPLFSMLSNNNGVDTFLAVSYKRISDSLALHGYADLSLQANLKWTVQATSGTWKQQSDYVNDLMILRQVKLYLVGDITGWDINNPFELITDKKSDRYGKVFYTYFKVNTTAQFLFIKTKGDWGSKYGITGGSAPTYDVGYNAGGDFNISTPGVYRLTIDVGTMKAHIQLKQPGVVGNMQGWNPASPITGGYIKRDQFLIIAPSNGTDAFKFHDGPVWDNGTPDKARWWGDAGNGNLDVDGNGGDIVANTSPRTRLIWDGTNGQQVKYEKSPAAEMRVVGDGINQPGVNDWDPGSSPQMTYTGNGVWTISITLKANKEIKFLAGNAWGAFDYEDNSGGANTLGTPRPIQWTGGGNFKTPAVAGTYTITLNEYTQTVTVN